MMTSNYEIRAAARISLQGKWDQFIVITLLYFIAQSFLGLLNVLMLLLVPIVEYGYSVMMLKNLRKEEVKINILTEAFDDYLRIWGTYMLAYIYIVLWSLLLLIPGIIKSYSYAMIPYILKDEPDLKYNGAIERSMEMMQGHKWQRFVLDLEFIGWAILAILTLGIGFLWYTPYKRAACAAFYEELKKNRSNDYSMESLTAGR